jgi:hypothetical protein
MGELYAYCRDVAATDSDKAKVLALIDATTIPKQDKKIANNRITTALSISGSVILSSQKVSNQSPKVGGRDKRLSG